jgi:hypothetical protein
MRRVGLQKSVVVSSVVGIRAQSSLFVFVAILPFF